MSLTAYQRTRTITETSRATEHRLMMQITGELIAARDSGQSGLALTPALFRNRELWSALAAACAARGNLLPDPLRAAIVSLGLWVDRYTSDVVAGRDRIDPLIEVNRTIMEGLHQGSAAGEATAAGR
ncbi:flagellar biosynthesis regulator FlaF [Sphingomonas sp. Tas61C01]|uniref:flagellar biosynthesis regulator FlaF n=1 Tax=Sphingomonas sp. Tas61C01 TaxID=3458297 RepID=UPI00403E713E